MNRDVPSPILFIRDTLPRGSLDRRKDDLPKMSESCRTDRELNARRPQNDDPALEAVGLCEPGLSLRMAERHERSDGRGCIGLSLPRSRPSFAWPTTEAGAINVAAGVQRFPLSRSVIECMGMPVRYPGDRGRSPSLSREKFRL